MTAKILTWIGAAAAVTAIVTGCGQASANFRPPATLTKIPGSAVEQVRLTGPAARILGVATVAVRGATVKVAGKAQPREVIPYSAVVYATDGSAWTYVTIAPRTYQREPITIADIQGNTVVLARGPAVGAEVVTVGAPELLGTEYNISGEQ